MSFHELLNHDALAEALKKQNITEPTAIQEQVLLPVRSAAIPS